MRLKRLIVLIVVLTCCVIITACSGQNEELNEERDGDDVIQNEQIDNNNEQVEVSTGRIDDREDEAIQDEDDAPLTEEAVSPFIEQYGFELGQMYPTYARAELWEHPNEQGGALLHTTRVGERYIFQEFVGDYIKVVSADYQGWTSLWYFTPEAEQAVDVVPYEMIVSTPTTFALYPNEEEPYGLQLESGQVVQIYKQFGDWVNVRAMINDGLYPGDKWIKKQHLTEFDMMLAKEGVLKLGSKIYDENGLVKEEKSGFPLSITGERENMFSFWAPNGQTGYILKEDFEPNPFIVPELVMTFAIIDDEDASYTVEELTESEVTVRYVDHMLGAEDDVRTVSFETMLMMQNGVRLYEVNLWLTYPYSGVELKPTVELIDAIETDPAFRGRLGALLWKHFGNVKHDLVISTNLIEEAYRQ